MNSKKNISHIQKKLLGWYRKNARDLPWRRTQNPYKIWVSEMMLQQTQVDTVIPYYQRWTKRFPTVQKLAKAPVSAIMKHWAGLGYYRRARNLHLAAQQIVKQHKGKLPSSVDTLMELPGIGRYSAGAIASIAFQKPVPVLDGNVERVLTRFYTFKKDLSKTSYTKDLWNLVSSLVPSKDAGDFNQALMELGATLCTPTQPQCPRCPLRSKCLAHQRHQETLYPIRSAKEKTLRKKMVALVIKNNAKVLVQKQKEKERWAHLQMFPFWENEKEMLSETKLRTPMLKRIMTVQHAFTKYRIQLEVYEYQILTNRTMGKINAFTFKGRPRSKYSWVKSKDLLKLALPSHHKKIAAKLIESET